MSSTWVCLKCKSRWPAMTTVEAFYNYRRANEMHPGERCAKEGDNQPV